MWRWLMLLVVVVSSKRRRFWQEFRALQKNCHESQGTGVFDEEINCIYTCVSSECYETIYATQPLEPGEEDVNRARAFFDCVARQLHKY